MTIYGLEDISETTLKKLIDLMECSDIEIELHCMSNGGAPVKFSGPTFEEVASLVSMQTKEVNESIILYKELKELPVPTKKQNRNFAKQQIKKGWKR